MTSRRRLCFHNFDMGNCKVYSLLLGVLFQLRFVTCYDYFVMLSHNGPVVLGANITFKAELFNTFGQSPSGTFLFLWKDDAMPHHTGKIEGTDTVAHWNVSYPFPYPPGQYEMEVIVEKNIVFNVAVTSARVSYNITGLLNGKVELEQHDGKRMIDEFVSNAEQVTHTIKLSDPDYALVSKNATSAFTYWFVDCVYYGYSTNFTFFFNYTEIKAHKVDALVVVSYEQHIPSTVTSTTSTTALTPTPGGNLSTTPGAASFLTSTTTTVIPLKNTSSTAVKETNDVGLPTTPVPTINVNGLFGANSSVNLPYVCRNSSIILSDNHKSYGYFQKNVIVKAPVSHVVVTGNTWMQPEDMLNLQISCNGSSAFYHCLKIKSGPYNATGNETCPKETSSLDCQIPFMHFFREPSTYTILIIIRNDVSKVAKSIVINMYEVTKQPQLSVIVVPVTCSLMAVILIVFGVAYYVQSRNRYTVEVADFDFGQVNDMEYKTFQERLRDGMSNVFNRTNEFTEPQTSWPPRRKYDNMK